MGLPSSFCWTKFGSEAGENASAIRSRKEFERTRNDGIFLWGIGNSIRPSLHGLLEQTTQPQIIFTPMLSAPSKRDANPSRLVLWTSAVDMNGQEYPIPPFSVVTSRGRDQGNRRAHYALICGSGKSIEEDEEGTKFHGSTVRNLLGGTAVGSSQVTCVVNRVDSESTLPPNYAVAFRATLVFPFLVKLCNPIDFSDQLPHLSEIRDFKSMAMKGLSSYQYIQGQSRSLSA